MRVSLFKFIPNNDGLFELICHPIVNAIVVGESVDSIQIQRSSQYGLSVLITVGAVTELFDVYCHDVHDLRFWFGAEAGNIPSVDIINWFINQKHIREQELKKG